MNEWTVFLALGTIIGLFLAVGKPILDLNTTITKLQATVENLIEDVKEFKKDNEGEHAEIKGQLSDHEKRIRILEDK